MYIGKKLKEIRKSKGITLVELSKKSRVQVATISRIENLKMTGTVESHMALAKALGIDVTQLYTDIVRKHKQVDVTDHTTSKDIFVHNKKASYEILTNNVLKKKMMPTLIKLEAGGQTNGEQYQPQSEKFIYVLEGEVVITIGEKTYPLGEGNSIYFDASLKHTINNDRKTVSRILSIATPVVL